VIGADFTAVLTAAQRGDEAAFARLWHDGQPALLRYLHVMAPDVAEDIAAEAWTHVVRGIAKFRGDEQNWRAWLFTTARRRIIDHTRQARMGVKPRWKVVATGTTGTGGTITFDVTPKVKTQFKYVFAGEGSYRASHSNVITLSPPK
jgi:DNA-directed RNA polymerase specialized sigma24 family protein